MDASIYAHIELRKKFNEKVDVQMTDFHPKDIQRVNNDDVWLRRFLIHHDYDMNLALNMLWDTCEWRKTNKVNELTDLANVNVDYLHEGSMFVHNKDKDGKPLFIFKCKKYVKGQKNIDQLKKCVIYWFERIERHNKNNQITVFFDMADTGLSNMDMDYTKYLISLCQYYYPNFLNYILIFEMPWVLNAAFKVIKSWLPAKAVQKIKFVNKASLKEYVDTDQALECWGGSDDYEFTFEPEVFNDSTKSEENKKKVHFADGSPITDSPPSNFGDSKGDDSFDSSKGNVKITPDEAISFYQEGIELSGSLTIYNQSDSLITYKVKTTSPEKFRVRPSCGTLPAGKSIQINVVLQSGYIGATIIRDKFLVMWFNVDHDNHSSNELNELWKMRDSREVQQFRLRCAIPGTTASHNGSPGATVLSQNSSLPASPDVEQKMSQLLDTVNHLSECLEKIQIDVKFNKQVSWVLLVLVAVFGISIMYLMNNSVEDSCYRHPEE